MSPTGNRISAYQFEKDQERRETKEYRRQHLEQFIRDRKGKFYEELYKGEHHGFKQFCSMASGKG